MQQQISHPNYVVDRKHRALRGLTGEEEALVQQEVEVATAAVVESRLALSQEKSSKGRDGRGDSTD